MRLQIIKSKNASSLYVVKSIFENGKRSSKVVEKLGTYAKLLETLKVRKNKNITHFFNIYKKLGSACL